ncbi:MAG: CAP domain-containing protein [Neisseria sp.]|nr:CAP domain-containing protein [Neisseria sp.]
MNKRLKIQGTVLAVAVLLAGCSNIGLGVGFGTGFGSGSGIGFGISGTLPTKNESTRHSITVAAPSAAAEQELQKELDAVNRLRADKGLRPLWYNPSLSAYATVRAQEIARKFSHTRPDGNDALKAVRGNVAAAENIAYNHKLSGLDAVNQWRNSPGHYANMTSERYREIGMGVYAAPSGEFYWVQVFSGEGGSSDYRFGAE